MFNIKNKNRKGKNPLNKSTPLGNLFKNKRGAIGAAMTWVVATMIILLITIIFIYSSYAMAKQKQLGGFKTFNLRTETIYKADAEQVLLALMKTKIDASSVREYIIRGEYNSVKPSVDLILASIPDLEGFAEIYIGDKEVRLMRNQLMVIHG